MSKSTPVFEAHALGQSIWLDNISRDHLLSGELRRWVEQEGIRGVTSNPAIFQKAIAQTRDYDPATRALVAHGAGDALDIFEKLAIADIQLGCDVLHPVWEESGGRDGYVSLEVSPHLANDTEATVREARRLADAVCRDNLLIKVPATPEGIPAIQQLISEGISINVTLLFAVEAYEAVHGAYLSGLEARLERGEPVSGIASVASFFVSRIDAAVGQRIEAALENETREEHRSRLKALEARVAIANAKLAYARFLETLAGERWARLADAGADPQRVLWASTGTKDPSLPKSLYVDELIGRHTVNTVPDATLEAFRAQGRVRDVLGADPQRLQSEAREVLSELDALGISLKEVTDQLLTRGCELFCEAFDGLLLSVETKRQELLGAGLPSMELSLGDASADLEAASQSWSQEGSTRQLWQRRAQLFSDADEASWMGWLDLPHAAPEEAIASASLREAVRDHEADTVVVVGMGGSSLWPDVLGRTFGPPSGVPESKSGERRRALVVLDSTVPDALEGRLAELDPTRCLFVVASKSGSTIEPNAILELLHARLTKELGSEAAGRHFVAITDPGSALERRAGELGFLGVALGRKDVGGRFSALSPFGMLPAEAIGLDAEALQARARRMAAACEAFVPPERNPGVLLGLALGGLAKQGRDKLVLSASPELAAFPAWVEQLVAESTGKSGKGLVPIVGGSLPDPERTSADRIFVDLRLDGDETTPARETKLAALAEAGHPVIRIALAETLDLAQEVFRWEIATAVIGAVWSLNPFDQPDVESAKVRSRALLENTAPERETDPTDSPRLEAGGARLFGSPALAADLATEDDAAGWLKVLIASLREGDVFAVNAFLDESDANRELLESLRASFEASRPQAMTLSFGPRYLHSTGQLQKGGSERLVGLQIWQSAAGRDAEPLEIPGLGGSFDALAEAQAAGDFAVLAERGRRVIGIDVGPDPRATLDALARWIDEALV